MASRMIHTSQGLSEQVFTCLTKAYGVYNECINSVDRTLLNQVLLDAAEKYHASNFRAGVEMHFHTSLQSVNWDANVVTLKGGIAEVKADLIIGADGAYSGVRREVMRAVRMDYRQVHASIIIPGIHRSRICRAQYASFEW